MLVGSSSPPHTPRMPSCADVFPAIYSTATNRQLCEQWAEHSINEGVDFITSFVLDMCMNDRKFRKGMTSKTTGSVLKATEEEFYAMMACAGRILRRKYHIALDYKVLKQKRCAGQKKLTGTAYLNYDWSYSVEFLCMTDEDWEEVRCRCDDDACVDNLSGTAPLSATTQTPKEEENPI